MKVSGMELSSSPKGFEHVDDSPRLEATTRGSRMAKEVILNNELIGSRAPLAPLKFLGTIFPGSLECDLSD